MDFSTLFSSILKRRRVSQNAAGPLLGVSGPYINQIIRRKRPPPIDQLERWGKILELAEPEVSRFIYLGHLAPAPLYIQQLIHDLEGKIEQLQAELNDVKMINENAETWSKIWREELSARPRITRDMLREQLADADADADAEGAAQSEPRRRSRRPFQVPIPDAPSVSRDPAPAK